MAQYTFKSAFNYIKWKDIGHLFLLFTVFPIAMIAKLFIRNFWLICEERMEARDNGYWFFKWVRENHPEQKCAYAIDKKSVDYKKVKGLGKVISYGSLSHWFWYLVADKNISSQKGGKPNAAVCYLFEVKFKLRKNNRVFLQHGITINDASWLYYFNCYFRLFITASFPEYEFICSQFNYPKQNIVLTGFSRYDNLIDTSLNSDLILIMPTWRNWLGRESHHSTDMVFTETDYYKHWNGLLHEEKLIELLKTYHKKLLFYPHRNMQKFIDFFSSDSEFITIADWRQYDVQQLLKDAEILITDYSSVFFDFSYMRKPVLFYQFDEAEYRKKQYAEGYFDYHENELGKWCGETKTLINMLEATVQKYRRTEADSFFPYHDYNNCKRIFQAIQDCK